MWLCFNDGFLSCVQDKDNPDMVFVRSRVKQHLEEFVSSGSPSWKSAIVSTPRNDYQWRIHMHKKDLAVFVAHRIMNIDYTNFKNSVEDHDLHTMYDEVWRVGVRTLDSRSYKKFWSDLSNPIK